MQLIYNPEGDVVQVELRELAITGQQLAHASLASGHLQQVRLNSWTCIQRLQQAPPQVLCAADHKRHRARRNNGNSHGKPDQRGWVSASTT